MLCEHGAQVMPDLLTGVTGQTQRILCSTLVVLLLISTRVT